MNCPNVIIQLSTHTLSTHNKILNRSPRDQYLVCLFQLHFLWLSLHIRVIHLILALTRYSSYRLVLQVSNFIGISIGDRLCNIPLGISISILSIRLALMLQLISQSHTSTITYKMSCVIHLIPKICECHASIIQPKY